MEIFFIAKVGENMSLTLLETRFTSYGEAQNAISALPKGLYQVQKFFEVA